MVGRDGKRTGKKFGGCERTSRPCHNQASSHTIASFSKLNPSMLVGSEGFCLMTCAVTAFFRFWPVSDQCLKNKGRHG